jgi:hypothetical protein
MMVKLARADTMTSGRCTHCGEPNTFPGRALDLGVHVLGMRGKGWEKPVQ